MATIRIGHVIALAGLVLLVGAEASVEEFKSLKDDVFGEGHKKFREDAIEDKLHSMIELIEAGDIPTEVQGDYTIKYLKLLIDDCKEGECNLDEDLLKIVRLKGWAIGEPNLSGYLRVCQARIKQRCRSDIYERVRDKLSSVDEENMKAVETLAKQSYSDLRVHQSGRFTYQLNADAPNHATVLDALKNLDPVGTKEMHKKWANSRATLAKFMDKIRLPCIKFMENTDSSVKLFTAEYLGQVEGSSKVSSWHYYFNICNIVVDNWDAILKDAYRTYRALSA